MVERSFPYLPIKLAALLAAVLLLFFAHTVTALAAPNTAWPARLFAPYAFIPKDFIAISNCCAETGQKYYTLAFIISDADGEPAWTGSRELSASTGYYADQIKAVRDKGGDVLISFGGEGGTELALNTADAAKLLERYQLVIDEYGLKWMDFDIEGKALSRVEANQRRNGVIEQLQAKNPGLKISFTLPVNPTGLEEESLVMVKDAARQGVRIESVNIMTMDYGAKISAGKKMGALAVLAAEAAHRQMAAIDPSITIGITPMIGQNDQKGEIFTLEDAHVVVDFAKKTAWVRSISFWSSNRDQPKGVRKGANHNSGIDQEIWDFTNIFKTVSD